MSAGSEFSAATRRFAAQAAGERRHLSPAEIQRRTTAGVAVGGLLTVFLSAVRVDRELTDTGFKHVKKAELRVPKTSVWTPVTGEEFYRAETAQLFRINTATGADSTFAAEIVCEVVVISG